MPACVLAMMGEACTSKASHTHATTTLHTTLPTGLVAREASYVYARVCDRPQQQVFLRSNGTASNKHHHLEPSRAQPPPSPPSPVHSTITLQARVNPTMTTLPGIDGNLRLPAGSPTTPQYFLGIEGSANKVRRMGERQGRCLT